MTNLIDLLRHFLVIFDVINNSGSIFILATVCSLFSAKSSLHYTGVWLKNNQTPLHYACKGGSKDILVFLMQEVEYATTSESVLINCNLAV